MIIFPQDNIRASGVSKLSSILLKLRCKVSVTRPAEPSHVIESFFKRGSESVW